MENYKHRNNTIAYLLKKAKKNGFNSPIYIGNKSLQAIYNQKRQEFSETGFELIIAKLDFMECIKSLKEGNIKKFSTNLPCYYFGEDHVCYEDTMKSILETYEKVFIIFECENYLFWNPMYVTHSTCAIVNNGRCYFINSHGEGSSEIDYYIYKKEKEQEGIEWDLKEGKDFTVISSLMKQYNIKMENTLEYMYYGANLQEYDNHGMCFIFPYYIWYYFENNVQDNIKLLKSGYLMEMIHRIFFRKHKLVPYVTNLKVWHLKNIKQETENCIKKQKQKFLKNIMDEFMGYMTQKKIQCQLH